MSPFRSLFLSPREVWPAKNAGSVSPTLRAVKTATDYIEHTLERHGSWYSWRGYTRTLAINGMQPACRSRAICHANTRQWLSQRTRLRHSREPSTHGLAIRATRHYAHSSRHTGLRQAIRLPVPRGIRLEASGIQPGYADADSLGRTRLRLVGIVRARGSAANRDTYALPLTLSTSAASACDGLSLSPGSLAKTKRTERASLISPQPIIGVAAMRACSTSGRGRSQTDDPLRSSDQPPADASHFVCANRRHTPIACIDEPRAGGAATKP